MATKGGFLVLMAVDGSPHSEEAVRWYATGVHAQGSRVVLVHTMDPILHSKKASQSKGDGTPAEIYEKLMDKEKEKVQLIEKKCIEILKERGIIPTFKTLMSSKPGEAIVHEAENQKASLIVTGSRGLGTLRRTVMGSVSDYILHHAPCPVLICKH